MAGSACSADDAGVEDAGDRPQHVTSLGIDRDSPRDDDDAGAEDARDSVDAGRDSVADAGIDAAREQDAAPCGGATSTTCWSDEDEDGYAAFDAGSSIVCDDVCPQFWTSAEPVTGGEDCAPDDPMIHPGATESCNDVNDDCDATVDEGASSTCEYLDAVGACVGGVCELASCDDGYDDCNALDVDGCEQALDVDSHCGACGAACHVLASCGGAGVSGVCACVRPSFGDGIACTGPGPLSAGATMSCGIAVNRSVTCWGAGIPEPPDFDFFQIAVGTAHACGVDDHDDVKCWGGAGYGEGQDIVGSFAQVVVGEYHTCALRNGGSVLCWGISKGSPGAAGDYGQAIEPAGEESFQQLAAGRYHTCGLRTDGTVRCWGAGQWRASTCGGTSPNCGQSSPPTGAADRFVQITAGEWHTCGLRSDGDVVCWGAGQADPNGGPDLDQASPPPAVKFTFISAGSYHTCGIKLDGKIQCWGAGDFDGESPPFHFRQSIAVDGTYVSVAAGLGHTCALTDEFQAVCWGADDYGQSSPPPGTWPLIVQ